MPPSLKLAILTDRKGQDKGLGNEDGSKLIPPCRHAPRTGLSRLYIPIADYRRYAATCLQCRIVLAAAEELRPDWIAEHERSGRGLIFEYHDHAPGHVRRGVGLQLAGGGLKSPEKGGDADYEFHLLRHPRGKHMYDARGPEDQSLSICPDSSTQAAFDRCAAWLTYCVENDEACRPPPQSIFVPRRLLDVGTPDGSEAPALVELATPVPYAALSYCWGPNAQAVLRTTTDNLERHRRSVSWEAMAPGIQDAVRVCRGLHIRYLWVDSLCIVQDDMQAWLADAAQMDQIYLHSLVTIAAMEPASCTERFLGPQAFGQAEWQRPVCVSVGGLPAAAAEGEVEARTTVFARPVQPMTDAFSSPFVSKCSLDGRGWTLQESLLPGRRLCFTGSELVWECSCRKMCECGHTALAPSSIGAEYGELGARVRRHLLPGARQQHGAWRDVVAEYSKRSLTRRADKLRAVSGLAKMVHSRHLEAPPQQHASAYAAGLGLQEFCFDLAWQVTDPASSFRVPTLGAGAAEQPEDRRIVPPSWSWASINNSAVMYNFDWPARHWKSQATLADKCRVDSVSCQLESAANATGAVIAGTGRAVLTSALAPVELIVFDDDSPDGRNLAFFGGDKLAFVRTESMVASYVILDQQQAVNVDKAALQSRREELRCVRRGYCTREQVHAAGGNEDGGESCGCQWGSFGQKEPLFAFKLFTWQRSSGAAEHETSSPELVVYFLLLRRSVIRDAYERVGLGQYVVEQNRCFLFDEAHISTVTIV